MCHRFVALLVLVAFVVSIDAVPVAAEFEGTLFTSALTRSLQDDIRTKRFLRAHKPVSDDEERTVSTSTVDSLVKSAVSTEQLQAWLRRGDSTDFVFKALQLQKAGDKLLDNPQLTAWISYMKLFNKENPTKKTSLIATLTAHYGDQGLTKIIEAAKQVKTSAKMANQLQTEQIQRWMGQGKTPEQVFGLLKLNKFWPFGWISSDLFEKPGLTTWIKYLDDFNAENPEKKTTLISILSARYNDKTLANMLIAAYKASNTNAIAKRIQAEQTQLWLKKGKKPSEIFTMLQLDKAGDKLFDSPLFTAWIQYADDFRLLHRNTELATMSTMIEHYSDEVVAKMIVAASEVPSTKNLAKRLQSELQRDWLFHRQSPNDVFIMMNLDREAGKMLENPLFNVWFKYGEYFDDMNFKKKWEPISPLTSFYGGDEELSKVLRAAMKIPSTKIMATDLQTTQAAYWLVKKKTPAQVAKLLDVDGAAVDDAITALFKHYISTYNRYYRPQQ